MISMWIRNTRFGWLALVLATLLSSTSVQSHSYTHGGIGIGHIWSPPTNSAEGIPVYGPLLNRGTETVYLVGVSTPIAAHARFRVEEEGETRWLDEIPLEPGKPLALAPWRVHIWLSGLTQKFNDGSRFDLTLDFGAAGTLAVEVVVQHAPGH